jgi:hypothetical protein
MKPMRLMEPPFVEMIEANESYIWVKRQDLQNLLNLYRTAEQLISGSHSQVAATLKLRDAVLTCCGVRPEGKIE